MMLYVLLFVGLAAGKYVPSCKVSEWTEWSECKTGERPYSFPAPRGSPLDVDRGAMAREGMMAEKSRQAGEKKVCLAEGTCPEFEARESIRARVNCVNGMAGEYQCSNIDMLSFLNFADMGGPATTGGNDIWGWTDPLTNAQIAIMGMQSGTGFVDVTDGENPVALGYLEGRGASSTWRDMKVVGNHVFIGSESTGHGMQVYDLTELRSLNGPPATLSETTHYSGFGNSHNIVGFPEKDIIIAVGATSNAGGATPCAGGLHIVDVSNPNNPTFVACFSDDGYTHDAECVVYNGPDTLYQGNDICFGYNEDTLTIVDVTNTGNIQQLSRTGYTGSEYTHQGWLSDDHTYLLLDDELDEQRAAAGDRNTRTLMWDISDLNAPVLRNTYRHSSQSIDHNLYNFNGLSYQANYESGLRVMDPNYLTYTMTEVGFFDVFPSRTAALFNGAWSNYPYFGNGKVIVSSIDYGLFVLEVNQAAVKNVQRSVAATNGLMTRYRDIMSKDLGAECPALVETQAC